MEWLLLPLRERKKKSVKIYSKFLFNMNMELRHRDVLLSYEYYTCIVRVMIDRVRLVHIIAESSGELSVRIRYMFVLKNMCKSDSSKR